MKSHMVQKSSQKQEDMVLLVRMVPVALALGYGPINLEMTLTSSNNLFPVGSALESSRNASSPTKQISCPSYTKKDKRNLANRHLGRKPWCSLPLPKEHLQGRPEWPLVLSLSQGYPDSLRESESPASPFSSSLLSQAAWGKHKEKVS